MTEQLNRTELIVFGASQVALLVKNPPAKAGDIRNEGSIPGSGRSPGGGPGNPLQYLAWRIPWTEEPGGLQFIGSQIRLQSDTTEATELTLTYIHTYIHALAVIFPLLQFNIKICN